MAVNAGDKATASSFNNLFVRLEAMRQSHLEKTSEAGESTTNIDTPFNTNVVSAGNIINTVGPTELKNDISYIEACGSFTRNFEAKGYVKGQAQIPSVGSLIKATDFNGWDTIITNMEGVCANYGRYSGQYGAHYSGFYSGFYSGQYGGHYGGHYGGQYSGFYSGFYSGQYDGHYRGHYGGHYGGRYSGYYSSRGYSYSSCFVKHSKVNLAKDIYKEIQNIEINDLVLSYNENTKSFENNNVIDIQKTLYKGLIGTITTDKDKIICTLGHAFLTQDGWKAIDPFRALFEHKLLCKKLTNKDILIGCDKHQKIMSINISKERFNDYVYNITVDNTHTYLINDNVVHNKTGLLVRNIEKEKK